MEEIDLLKLLSDPLLKENKKQIRPSFQEISFQDKLSAVCFADGRAKNRSDRSEIRLRRHRLIGKRHLTIEPALVKQLAEKTAFQLIRNYHIIIIGIGFHGRTE